MTVRSSVSSRMAARASAAFLLLASAARLSASSVPVALEVANTGGLARAGLAWTADPGAFYEIYATTNLVSGPWALAVDEPVSSTNLVGQMEILSSDTTRFFQVRPLDTQGPSITARYPGTGAVGVGRAAQFSVLLSDPSGIDSNAFRLAVNGGAPLLWDSPGVSVTSSRFDYDPALAATNWGGFGATVSVSFACADLKGNATSDEWSFVLEVEPQVSGNLLHLAAPAPAGGGPARLAMPPPDGVVFLGGLTIVDFLADRIVFSYAGEHGLYVGAILVSHDPGRPFYRRILSLAAGPGAGQVTAFTEDVPLTDIVQDGSFSPEVFIPVGGQTVALWGDGDFGVGIPFSYNHEFAAGPIEWTNVRLRPAELNVKLDGSVGLSCQISDWQVAALGADFDSSLELGVRAGVDIYSEIGSLSRTRTLGSAPLGYVGGLIGPVPVWIELQVGVDLSFAVSAEGAMSFDTGFDAYATAGASLDWTPDGGLTHSYGGSLDVVQVPLEVEVQLSAEANLYLKPRLSALVYSLAGASLDYRRGPCLKVAWPSYPLTDPIQAEITLSDAWSVNGALTCVGVNDGELPEVRFLSGAHPLRTWYWPEITNVVFTVQPSNVTAEAGTRVTLVSSASGKPAPTYQWYQNDRAVPFKTAAQLGFTMGDSSTGTYHVVARNKWWDSLAQTYKYGCATSRFAIVTMPAGMALIPAGSFRMGDNLGDGWEVEVPVHTVYVSAFYMDRTEVTWGKWKEVRTYAAANEYDIGSVGSGKADNHPVHSVNWYDCVKWLNARSEMEGLSPCYRRGGAVYKSGQHDDIVCDWSANGYRLPTEAEWEKAARGGLSGRRFPWGDTIQHSRANYYASASWDWYDTNGYDGFHPSYATGGYPYTSPVGAFAANGYGLHDMAGNLWEWCWDWFDDYPSGSVSNPRGPSAPSPNWGSNRVIRGGSWDYDAWFARVAYRDFYWPAYRGSDFGFRSVRPQGQ